MMFKTIITMIACAAFALCAWAGESRNDQPVPPSEQSITKTYALTNAPQTVDSDTGFSLSLTEAFWHKGAKNELLMNFTLQGGWGYETRADVATVMLDDTVVRPYYLPSYLDVSDGQAQMTVKIDSEILQYSRITNVTQVSLFMTMSGINREKVCIRFDFDMPADLSIIVPSLPETSRPLAVFEQEGLCFELLDLSYDTDNEIICNVHMKNNNDTFRYISNIHGAVNGIHLRCENPPFAIFIPFVLPANGEIWFPIKFYVPINETKGRVSHMPRKVSDIRHINLYVQQKADVSFKLP